MKYFYQLLIVLFMTSLANAQDVHLTQFYTSNLSLNPAYTGHYDGDVRAVLNARTQWSQIPNSFKTNMFSVEKKILRYADEFGLGVIFMNDQLSANFLYTNKIYLSASYQKEIKRNVFRVGVQGGAVFRRIDMTGQTLPDQWDYAAGIFNPASNSGEPSLQNSWGYSDINAGLGWSRRFKTTVVSGGYAIFHMNKATEKFSIYSDKGMPMRHVFNASATHYLSPIVWLTPNLLYMRMAKATDFVFATNIHRAINDELSLSVGAGYRGSTVNTDAFLAIGGATYKRFTLGLSTDFTLSTLRKGTHYKSAWEISLIYTTPSRKPGRITVPCDRY